MEEVVKKYRKKAISFNEYREVIYDYAIRNLKTEKKYRILRRLGDGTYGRVLSATTPDRPPKTVAVKIITREYTAPGELDAWPTFGHPNVLPLLEVVRLRHADVFVTPLMKTDLFRISREDGSFLGNPAGLDLVRGWLRDVLRGVDYLHGQKVCHLDIKADNVLIDFGSTALLGDFSFIEGTENLVSCYGLCMPFRPPETCPSLGEDVPVDGKKFDIWSFGVLAMNVLTRHLVLRKAKENYESWFKEISPLLSRALNVNRFGSLMKNAFPASKVTSETSRIALDFVKFVMRMNPDDRPPLTTIMEHPFLRHTEDHNIEEEEKKSSVEGNVTEVNVLTNSHSFEKQKRTVEDDAKIL